MSNTILSEAGIPIKMYSDSEHREFWKEQDDFDRLMNDPNTIHYTNDRNELPYQRLKTTTSGDTEEITILANGKICAFKVSRKKFNETSRINLNVKRLFELI